ncbi:MAG: DUF4234 domain-containing protein [Ruminococcaceae bacterium]|nr:DUF4234 domain-containing protein [Oscillospiraceae bacterium]
MNRSIGMALILSIITCGIYGIYWMVVLNDDLNQLAGRSGAASGVTVFLLTLVTCGIYGYYWAYKMGENVDTINSNGFTSTTNTGIVYLVLSLFGLGIINYCLMQDAINKRVG